jgi:hypothetical protein
VTRPADDAAVHPRVVVAVEARVAGARGHVLAERGPCFGAVRLRRGWRGEGGHEDGGQEDGGKPPPSHGEAALKCVWGHRKRSFIRWMRPSVRLEVQDDYVLLSRLRGEDSDVSGGNGL